MINDAWIIKIQESIYSLPVNNTLYAIKQKSLLKNGKEPWLLPKALKVKYRLGIVPIHRSVSKSLSNRDYVQDIVK